MAGSVTAGAQVFPDDDPVLTVDDIIRAGACVDGTYSTLKRVAGIAQISAAMPASDIRKLLHPEERGYVDQAEITKSNGYGNGDGYGNGAGYGIGYGYGYGDGYGDGNGNGDGDGDGNGYGDGNGDG